VLIERQNTLLATPIEATGKPTSLSILGDKFTPNRRTLQVVGVNGYVNGTTRALVAGVKPLSGESGIKVTETLETGLKSLGLPVEDLKARLVGGSFDGEYFYLSVPDHYLAKIGVDPAAKDWYTFW